MLILNEEPLSDPLVHNDNCDEGLLLGCVIGLIDGLTKLSNLLLKYLLAHSITDTITVNDEVLREITVPLSKATKRSLDCVLQLLVDDLLPFALKDAL